ncbi:hypothetical protein B0H11DRAFT_1943840 [Mycena galericulata]|nr:hypothetical protein B0H11DRAFT_1943840 [Mycena galericulata]
MSLLSFLVSARAPPVIELAGRSSGHNVIMDSLHTDVHKYQRSLTFMQLSPGLPRSTKQDAQKQQVSEDELQSLVNIICSAADMNSENGDTIITTSLERYGETLTSAILRRARDYRDHTSSLSLAFHSSHTPGPSSSLNFSPSHNIPNSIPSHNIPTFSPSHTFAHNHQQP